MNKKFFVFSKPMEDFYNLSEPVNIFSKTLDGIYIDSNDCMAEMAQLPISLIVGKKDIDLSWYKLAPVLRRNDRLVQSTDSLRMFYEEPVFKDRSSIRCLSIKTPLRDSSNHIVGTFGIAYYLKKMSLSTIIDRINSSGIIPGKSLFTRQFDIMCHKHFLSPLEEEYLYFIIRGMPMREIGKVFNVPPKTVRYHFESIKHKFNCRNEKEIISKILDSELE